MAITQVSNSLVKQDLTISGGTVDNTVIGSGTPAAGTFTTIAGTLASAVAATTQAASDNSTKVLLLQIVLQRNFHLLEVQ